MKRQTTSLILVAACLFGGARTASAKEKPILERIEARVAPISISVGSTSDVRIVIYEYSTDEELQHLAQAFARRGNDGLESALGKMKKGYMQIRGEAHDLAVELAESKPQGTIRRWTIVAEGYQAPSPTLRMRTDCVRRDYPFTSVQLEFDELGNGKGEIVAYVKLGFDAAGQMTINRWDTKPFRLIDVRSTQSSPVASRRGDDHQAKALLR